MAKTFNPSVWSDSIKKLYEDSVVLGALFDDDNTMQAQMRVLALMQPMFAGRSVVLVYNTKDKANSAFNRVRVAMHNADYVSVRYESKLYVYGPHDKAGLRQSIQGVCRFISIADILHYKGLQAEFIPGEPHLIASIEQHAFMTSRSEAYRQSFSTTIEHS